MERCPCCNARLGSATQCPRCQTDLSKTIAAEQAAHYWLHKAIQSIAEQDLEQSLAALKFSLRLHKTRLALVFQDFLINRQCQTVLDLLQQNQLLSAKQQLYKARLLIPHSHMLKQLNSFSDYLLAKPL